MSVFYLAGKSHVVEVYGDEALSLACGDTPLKELKPNTVDAAQEKHVPVPTYDAAKHEVVTKRGTQRVNLTAVDAPTVTFRLADGDAPVKVLAYCNLHGLWQAEI